MSDLLIAIFATLVFALSFPYIWNVIYFSGLLASECIKWVSDPIKSFINGYKIAWKSCIEDIRGFLYGSEKR